MSENRLFENGLNVGRKYRNPAQLLLYKYDIFIHYLFGHLRHLDFSILSERVFIFCRLVADCLFTSLLAKLYYFIF
jgi:hypothetical protein